MAAIFNNIRSTASSIYEQYLGKSAQHGIVLDEALTKELFNKIDDPAVLPNESWFDGIQTILNDKLQVSGTRFFVLEIF